MVNATASGRYLYRETALYQMPDSKYFIVITPYFSNVRLRFANRTYGPANQDCTISKPKQARDIIIFIKKIIANQF